jgi:(R,R)-butanediol dehydrogenase / meso-butanediol dehydrogenase / diacetyl reductase
VKAAVFVGAGTLDIQNVPDPVMSRSDEVILEVAANGVCGTDVHALDVPPAVKFYEGVIVGHEFSGTVIEAGSESGFAIGDRLAVLPQIPCYRCHACREGMINLCLNMGVFGAYDRNGGAAEYVAAPREVLYAISPDLPLERAALAEPLSVTLSASTRVQWHPGRSAVIFGAGPIGLLFLLLAKGAGAAPLITVEPSPGRRQRAVVLGADHVVDPGENAIEQIRELTKHGADVVIDSVGTLLPMAIDIAGLGAQVVVFGINESASVSVPPYQILRKELRITGTFLAKNTFQLALKLLTENRLGFDRLTERFALTDANLAIAKLRAGDAVKALLVPGQ